MRKLITALILYCTHASATTWKTWFEHAHSGDFVVTEHDSTYALLFIQSKENNILTLEEVTTPTSLISLDTIKWQEWVAQKAPGHTSWTRYLIDLEKQDLINAFSYTQQGWLYLDPSQQFLTTLLSLPLSPLPKEHWRKIGPPPTSQEEDRRAVWLPPCVREGKKQRPAAFSVFQGKWPKDQSPLSECSLTFYFPQESKSLPFPCWIDIKSPHYQVNIRSIDAGQGIISFYAPAPSTSRN